MIKRYIAPLLLSVLFFSCSSNKNKIEVGAYEFDYPKEFEISKFDHPKKIESGKFGSSSGEVWSITNNEIVISCFYGFFTETFASCNSDPSRYEVLEDSVDGHFRRIIIGKNPIRDITSIYLEDPSTFDVELNKTKSLSMSTFGLNKEEQHLVVEAFRSGKTRN